MTERLERVDQLGYFIYNLCRNKETYKLQRRDRILGMSFTCRATAIHQNQALAGFNLFLL